MLEPQGREHPERRKRPPLRCEGPWRHRLFHRVHRDPLGPARARVSSIRPEPARVKPRAVW